MDSKRSVVLLMGPPGAGKGAFAQQFVEYMAMVGYPCTHLSTGDILRRREFGSHPRGGEIDRLLGAGELIPDELMYEIITQRLAWPDIAPLCLMDGMPRTVPQAEWMLTHLNVVAIVHLNVPFQVVVDRVSGRRIHPASGRTYNILNPSFQPQRPGLDDETGEPLIMRPEDDPKVVIQRLATYQNKTVPAIQYYRALAGQEEQRMLFLGFEGERSPDELARVAAPFIISRISS